MSWGLKPCFYASESGRMTPFFIRTLPLGMNSYFGAAEYPKMKYGTEQGHFLGQKKLTHGHNKTNLGTDQGDFLGQEKLILGLNKMNYGT